MNVLLIEDEKGMSAALCRILKEDGCLPTPVYNGDDGLGEALTDGYDAVILDVMLPGRDGFSVLREMRRKGKTTPVLMLTASIPACISPVDRR